MTPRTPTPTLIAALRSMARDPYRDRVDARQIAEAADRLEEMEHTWLAKEVNRRRIEMSRMRRERQSLINWIREQGKVSGTCAYNVLREVCEDCRCHRSNKATL